MEKMWTEQWIRRCKTLLWVFVVLLVCACVAAAYTLGAGDMLWVLLVGVLSLLVGCVLGAWLLATGEPSAAQASSDMRVLEGSSPSQDISRLELKLDALTRSTDTLGRLGIQTFMEHASAQMDRTSQRMEVALRLQRAVLTLVQEEPEVVTEAVVAPEPEVPAELCESKGKGDAFEEYVIKVIQQGASSRLVHWRSDKVSTVGERPVYPLSNAWPDMEWFDWASGSMYAVECKWRASWWQGDRITIERQKLLQYNHWATGQAYSPNQTGRLRKLFDIRHAKAPVVPTLLALGVGGRPGRPDALYIIPLKEDWIDTLECDGRGVCHLLKTDLARFEVSTMELGARVEPRPGLMFDAKQKTLVLHSERSQV